MSRNRRLVRYAELTSLVDVMFILMFATIIQVTALSEDARARAVPASTRAAAQNTARAVPRAAPDASVNPGRTPTATYESDRARALRDLTTAIGGRRVVVVRVSEGGTVASIEQSVGGRPDRAGLSVPLLARVADPDVVLTYLGDRSPELRVCGIVRAALPGRRLDDAIVAIVPDVARARLPVALVEGLRRDAERCFADERAMGVLIDPVDADGGTP